MNSRIDIFSFFDAALLPYSYCWLLLFDDPTRTASFHCILQLLANKFPKVGGQSEGEKREKREEKSKGRETIGIFLLRYLYFVYPTFLLSSIQVRKVTAEELYVRIMTDEHIVPASSLDKILAILAENKWYLCAFSLLSSLLSFSLTLFVSVSPSLSLFFSCVGTKIWTAN